MKTYVFCSSWGFDVTSQEELDYFIFHYQADYWEASAWEGQEITYSYCTELTVTEALLHPDQCIREAAAQIEKRTVPFELHGIVCVFDSKEQAQQNNFWTSQV